MITLKINNQEITVEPGTTILQAAKKLGINIPTLCHLQSTDGKVHDPAACRICVVEIKGRHNLATACNMKVSSDMEVFTNTDKVFKARRSNLELILANHPKDCLSCMKSGKCTLQKIVTELGVNIIDDIKNPHQSIMDFSSPSLIRDMDKCIYCKRCEFICNEVQNIGALSSVNRGIDAFVSTFFNRPLNETNCVACGQCVNVCPTGALMEKRNIYEVLSAINDPNKTVVVQTAPAVRVALGEEFNLNENVTGKMVTALRRIGFDHVFDTNFAADLTIMEEANEFIERLTSGGVLPMFTSCCPAWVTHLEKTQPNMLKHLSTCKSPQQMWGSIAKNFLAEKLNIDRKNMVVVSIMPCIAKKAEVTREEMKNDVDFSITTRELAAMIKMEGINLACLPESDYDDPLGESTGAGSIFGVTGGVMEAALRTAAEWVTKKPLEKIEFDAVRGFEGVKEAKLKIGDNELKIAVISGLANAQKVIEKIKNKEVEYHFVEVMSCPNGCINGGGQPYSSDTAKILKQRKDLIYSIDKAKNIRKSHENPSIISLYDSYLEKPGSSKTHHLLHTTYKDRRFSK